MLRVSLADTTISKGILDRYQQIRPKFIFAETEVVYAGKKINLLTKIQEVVQNLSGLQAAVLFPSRVSGEDLKLPDMSKR